MLRLRSNRIKLFLKILVLLVLFTLILKNSFMYFTQNEDEFMGDKNLIFTSLNLEQKNEYLNDLIKFDASNQNFDFKNQIEHDLYNLELQKNNLNELKDELGSNYKEVTLNRRALKIGEKTSYLILEYTNVFFMPKFCSKSTKQIFDSEIEKCEFNNCKYTCDKERDLGDADALLFHQRDLESELKFKYQDNFNEWFINTKQLPFKSIDDKIKNNPDQVWILWNDESSFIDTKLNRISKFFNWTLSYKTDAEIFEGSYGFFQAQSVNSDQFYMLKKQIYIEHFKRRKNAILWFVSNCKSTMRNQFALEMSKYYPVYVYGKCDFDHDKNQYPYLNVFNLNRLNTKCERKSRCEEIKLKSFKYYFAFENRNCSDYITEKVWRSLNNSLIPIVMQPNKESYLRYSIPERSILHLNDFNHDARKLASYLNEMNKNFDLYFDHLKWTFIYMKTIYDDKITEPHRMCQLCKKLNTYTSTVNYKLIADFFNKKCNN